MLNKVILLGNVGQEPEFKSFTNGNRVCNFSLATSESWKDKNGEKQIKTEWHKIQIFNENIIKICQDYVKKGTKLYIEGSIESKKYQATDGTERINYCISLKQFNGTLKILSSKEELNEDSEPKITTSIQDDDMPF